jgi:hypothetical protein
MEMHDAQPAVTARAITLIVRKDLVYQIAVDPVIRTPADASAVHDVAAQHHADVRVFGY